MKYAGIIFMVISFTASQAWGYESNQTGISVEGEAYESVAPDMLSFKIGIKTHEETLDGVLASNLSSTQRVLKALSEHSILKEDIKTSRQRFGKHFRTVKKDGQHVKIHDGFDAETQISVILRGFAHYDPLLKALVQDPDVSLDDLRFEVSHTKAIQERLIQSVYQDARQKAETLAAASGVTLGKPQWMNLDSSDLDKAGGSYFSIEEDSDLMPGQISIGVAMRVIFAIE